MPKRYIFVLLLLSTLFLISSTIDLNDLFDYVGPCHPNYITKDNTTTNLITDAGATLGRVLFYDKNLSANNTIACASCHKQEFAFSDTATVSVGLSGGTTGRHSMRLVNTRFADEVQFFWDKRATSLEDQTSQPIQDHVEMGFSGSLGDPDFNDLIAKIDSIDYYQSLFSAAFGDTVITESRIQMALAQFIRSIQSFDSRFDVGRAQVGNINQTFANFTAEENQGKTLFLEAPGNGGAGCQGCHRGPEFDIDSNSDNNNIIAIAGDPSGVDVTNTRAPSLRDLMHPSGVLNGPMMHDGSFLSLMDVINHYDDITIDPNNTNLDPRLQGPPPGNGQNLNLTQAEKDALVAFLLTLTGSNIYTAAQWSDPFDSIGNLDWTPLVLTSIQLADDGIDLLYNPAEDYVQIALLSGSYSVRILDETGLLYEDITVSGTHIIPLANIPTGLYFVEVINIANNLISMIKIIKQ